MRLMRMNEEYAKEIIKWQYEKPYQIYNMKDAYDDLMNGYFAVTDDRLIGFCCFGIEGQVPPGDYTIDAIDFGLGQNPDLCGKGHGKQFFKAIKSYAEKHYDKPLRLTVAAFNSRAIKLYSNFGFKEISRFNRGDQLFIIMM